MSSPFPPPSSGSPFGDPPPPPPPPSAGAPYMQQTATGAVVSIVLGVISLMLCPLCGPVAWSLGRSAEREVDASGGQLGGRGIATAGKILGMIGTVLLVLLVLFFVGAVVLGMSVEGGLVESGSSTSVD